MCLGSGTDQLMDHAPCVVKGHGDQGGWGPGGFWVLSTVCWRSSEVVGGGSGIQEDCGPSEQCTGRPVIILVETGGQ